MSVRELFQSLNKLAQSLSKLFQSLNKLAQSLSKLFQSLNKLAQSLSKLFQLLNKLAKSLSKLFQSPNKLAQSSSKLFLGMSDRLPWITKSLKSLMILAVDKSGKCGKNGLKSEVRKLDCRCPRHLTGCQIPYYIAMKKRVARFGQPALVDSLDWLGCLFIHGIL